MKTNVSLLLSILVMLVVAPNMNAQKKKPSKKGIYTAWYLHKEMSKMIDSAKLRGKATGPCDPLIYIKSLGKKGIIPSPKKELGVAMDSLGALLTNPRSMETYGFDYWPLSEFNKSKTYGEFVNNFYNKDIGQLNKTKFKASNEYYRELKKIKKEGVTIYKRTVTKKNCTYSIETKFNFTKWDGTRDTDNQWIIYRAIFSGKLETNIKINCKCKGKSTNDLKKAHFRYEMPTSFVIDFSKKGNKQLWRPVKKRASNLDLVNTECCTANDISYEDPSLEIAPTENISLPNQTLGAFGGVGFGQDFEESSICLGAEYLYNATKLGNSALFVGANVELETSSFMENTNTWVGFGPTAQLFIPISPRGDVHVTNGLSATVIFGSNDNNGIRDDISGFGITLNTGLNVPLGNNISVALILPVLNYQNLTFESEEGESSFEQQNTSLFIGKGSTTKLGVRFKF
ncbi:MAG: hypothetical protein CMC75_06875 [Flavobacteriaceae bacterium]|nr:hypothetical protein [Flavobacteriaceae bacterium]